MNALSQIILINSATVDYYELHLDGNVHFVGTQGTGKSTILRAILFFYNADARKLGISKEKSPFSDYYFPYADSYVVYEVSQGVRNFCVWLYKKQNRLCFRFLDGHYIRDMFLDGQCARAEHQVIEQANQKGFKVHRPIYNFTEYRDIIYGANKALNRFHLLQNPAYQNIPRTISNIFLNSSLDGGFIKTTIINSLSDDPFEINLEANRHHIETARNDYRDVSEYLVHEKKAQNIVAIYERILKMEEEKKELAWKTGASYNFAKEKEHEFSEQLLIINENLSVQKEKINRLIEDFATGQRRIQDKLSVVRRDISKANQLIRDYNQKDIQKIIDESERKKEYEATRSQIRAQLELLTSELKDAENQYKINKERLEIQHQKHLLEIDRSAAIKKEKFQHEAGNLDSVFYISKEKLNDDFQNKFEEQKKEKDITEKKLMEIDYQVKNVQTTFLLKEERDKLDQKQQELIRIKADLISAAKITEQKRDSAKKEGVHELEILELNVSRETEVLMVKKKALEGEIEIQNSELNALSGSLLEYLEQNKPDWGQTVGKVISREILLNNDLQPSLSEGDNFYGLYLDLAPLSSVQISKGETARKLELNRQLLTELNKLTEQHHQDIQVQKDKLQKKFNKRISELNQEILNLAVQKNKMEINIEKCHVALEELKDKESQIKQEELGKKEEERNRLNKELKEVDAYVENIRQRHNKSIRELETSWQAQRRKISLQLTELDKEAEKMKKSFTDQYKSGIKELEQQRHSLLQAKGINMDEIQRLEGEQRMVTLRLTEIANNYPLVIEYRKDCEDYINRLDDFRRDRKNHEGELEHLRQLHQNRIHREQAELEEMLGKRNELEHVLELLLHETESFERFSKSQLFDELQHFIMHHDKADNWMCDENIGRLQDLALVYLNNMKIFAGKVTEFLGYFSQDNCLGFQTGIMGDLQYRAFAENLREFVGQQKIIDFKTEVTRKYAMVLMNIVNETNELLQKEDDVLKVVQRINADFRKSNFVGVVKSIEMRLQDSTNKIIQLLRKIRNFHSETNLNYGEINLFNQGSTGGKNDEAVKLLENLLLHIGIAKASTLKLEDAFELEFRIRENENDTNWVSRLANVGSNGTDVLVKSMIYINLLSIFKNSGLKSKTDAILHCLIDEVGILHDSNVTGLISFAGERNIRLINGSPNSHNEQDYRHIYMFRKNLKSNKTGIVRLISHEL